MVKCSEEELDDIFTALGEPVRRSLIRSLASGEKSISHLAEPFPMTMPALMKHISMLERAGLVTTEKRGRIRYCQLELMRLKVAQDWIAESTAFWVSRLESLSKHLEENS